MGSIVMPLFSRFLHIHIEKSCVSNVFHRFQVISMKLATLYPYELKLFMTHVV